MQTWGLETIDATQDGSQDLRVDKFPLDPDLQEITDDYETQLGYEEWGQSLPSSACAPAKKRKASTKEAVLWTIDMDTALVRQLKLDKLVEVKCGDEGSALGCLKEV